MRSSLQNDQYDEPMAYADDPRPYQINTEAVLTPALAIYPELVRHNIARTIELLDGRPNRWRPHLKTVKVGAVIKLLVKAGVTTAKCATTLELLVACQSGVRDVLVAFPHTGANARRIAEIAEEYRDVQVSAMVESAERIQDWIGTRVGLFIDVNPGMDRTGIGQDCLPEIVQLADQISRSGLLFRGVHFYDGHSTEESLDARTAAAAKRYRHLLEIVTALEENGTAVPQVITAGTPALPCALAFEDFKQASFIHQVSPGTIVYNDTTSLAQLPQSYDLRPAVAVISRVVSHPKDGLITCDAGHKSVSVDSGVPNCTVLGRPDLVPSKPSEEHLPMSVKDGAPVPDRGSVLYLIPRHVCPTVNNFDYAAMIEGGRITSVEDVNARGREAPQTALAFSRQS